MANIETDIDTIRTLMTALRAKAAAVEATPLEARDKDDRLAVRRSLIPAADDLALERIVGRRDLQHINFLARGLEAARSICRIRIRNRADPVESFGTGFLAGPGLLLTNWHVLPTAGVARHSLVEFDYEEDINFVPKTPRVFNLLPGDARAISG